MHTKRSLVQIYLISLVALSAIPLSIFGYTWIAKEYDAYTTQSANWRDSYVESRRELLRREVDNTAEYIEFKQQQLSSQLYQSLRQQLAVGLSLIENTRKEFSSESRQRQIARVQRTMASLKFSDGKGFYFLFDDGGKPLLSPVHPQGGARISDSAALAAFARQISKVTKEKGHEFFEYRFAAQQDGDVSARNFSFVYYHKALGIYFGASIYLHDEVIRIKNEVIERLKAVPVDPNNSILFIADSDGRQIVNAYDPESVGTIMPGLVAESSKLTVNQPSVYTELLWNDHNQENKPLVSYLRRFDAWGWVIGSGVYLDELNIKLAQERQALQERVEEHIRFIIILAFVLMMFSAVAARWLAKNSARGFHIFQQFFADASKRSTAIDVEKLPFAEFQRLAEDANYMVKKRTETERALKLSEQRFQLALDAAQNHLWDLDLHTGLVNVGESFFRMLGYNNPSDPYPVGSFKDLVHEDDLSIVAAAVDSWLGLATGNTVEFRVRDRAGRHHWIYSRGDVVESNDRDQPVRAMGIMTNITERKRMEQELVDAKIAAEDALHAKGQFLSSVSHELRTPLNGVLGYAQLLQREEDMPAGSVEYLRAIESCGKHLLTLINDVLDLAKIESGNISVVCGPNKISELLDSVGDIVGQRAKSKGLEFVIDSEAAVPAKLQLDEVKLRQVLVNLLDNAVKFTAKGGRVELMIGVDLSRQQLLFSVTDSGIGIPETKVREVFEPFRQVNPRDGQGTGLGLAICRRLVEAMGGQIHLRSEEGRGSCFYFDLPLVEVSDSDAEFFDYAQFEPQEAVLPQGIVKNPAIIIADDVSVNRQVLMGMLADVSNDIREAINGEEVVNQLKERPARLVLMDLRMPVMDGMQATRIIKKDLCMDDVHIVMASATTDEAIMAEAVIAGCDRFLPKPIAMSDVLKVVAETCADPDADAVIISVPEPRAGTRELPLSTPVHNEERQLPPNDVLKALMSGAKLGDITAIREQLALLRKQHTECESFAVEMEEFLNTFDFERMGQVLLNDITEVTTDGA